MRKVDTEEVLRLLSLTNNIWLSSAAIVGILKAWLMGTRWRYFMPSANRLPITKSFYYYAIGNMASMIFPFRAGDFIRAFMVAKALSITNSRALGSIVSEHIVDFLILCCLLLFTL